MGNSLKSKEQKMRRALNALRTLAPDTKFSGQGVAEFEAEVSKSLTSRARIEEISIEKAEEMVGRDEQDDKTLLMLEQIVRGIVADPNFGPDSALYGEMGFIRESERKSGLTRKRKAEDSPAE